MRTEPLHILQESDYLLAYDAEVSDCDLSVDPITANGMKIEIDNEPVAYGIITNPIDPDHVIFRHCGKDMKRARINSWMCECGFWAELRPIEKVALAEVVG